MGKVRERNKKIYGVGINDNPSTDMYDKCYSVWHHMLRRCYDNDFFQKRPTYIGCCVCEDWLLLSNFRTWFEAPANGYREGYHVDKDILYKGNKIYSPETCCFVPQEINVLFTLRKRDRGDLPLGVSHNGSHFKAIINKYGESYHLGTFSTIEEAFQAYKNAKESYIKEVAQEYYDRGEITKRVYDALMRYEVEITD